ncbi:MAG: hypothetical protein JO102_04880 [Elusimicrobia bacterium]|nr:hypothetical protein [Elusimicrobiota bacterium]
MPDVLGGVKSLTFVTSDLIFAGTTAGEVFRARRIGSSWQTQQTDRCVVTLPIQVDPMPWVTDLKAPVTDGSEVIAVLSGFGFPHVLHGTFAMDGTATWTSISGAGDDALPDIPVNALLIDPGDVRKLYIGTDFGVYWSADGGTSWNRLSNGLPNTGINELVLTPSRMLLAATDGRGVWSCQLSP